MPSNQAPGAEPQAVFSEREILCRTPITESGELFRKLIALLAEHHPEIDPDEALRVVLAREAAAPTFIAPDVAMPHARLQKIDQTFVAIATSEAGVRFPGSETRARLVVLVLAPALAPIAYLRVASAVARRLQAPSFLEQVVACETAAGVYSFFNLGGGDLPDYVCAEDMMIPPPAVLNETNSVKDAIDVIVRTGLAEVPVVDKEGDLVGVASARAILGVCLPDYLLWMEDLSRFSNFEPFETLLRKESSTWLADITDDEYASVGAGQPAIAVAEAMARRQADVCYVLDGAHLVGVVTLPRFLHNVFRD